MTANPNYLHLKRRVPEDRITLLQGGTRSGKTFSAIYYIIWLCKEHPHAGMEIDIVRDTFTALKATVWKDFKEVLLKHDLYNSEAHNKTEHIYTLFGNHISYYGADNPAKIHGRSRDILWVNEAHQFPEETVDQLFPRTRHRIIADYNPALPVEHWLDRYLSTYEPCITTYKDNPHLTDAQVEDIESKKHLDYWWRVYGTGQRAQPQGAIFTDWTTGPFPDADAIYGMDFGFSTDPTALLATHIDKKKKKIHLKEITYQTKLSAGDIHTISKAKASDALIVADSAEPRLISDLRTRGLNIVPAIKGQGSVNAGLSIMQEYQLVIDPESKNLQKELTNYRWLEKRVAPVDEYNHAIDAARYAIYYQLERPNRGRYAVK